MLCVRACIYTCNKQKFAFYLFYVNNYNCFMLRKYFKNFSRNHINIHAVVLLAEEKIKKQMLLYSFRSKLMKKIYMIIE